MMVRMLRSAVGPVGSFGVGQVVDLADEVAQRWCAAGLCVPMEPRADQPVKRKRTTDKKQLSDGGEAG